MSADLLQETIQLRYPRLLVSGVDYNDAQVLLKRIKRFEDWCAEWVIMHPRERVPQARGSHLQL